MKNLEMTEVIDFIGIKKEIRKILKRKKNNEVNLNIIEKNNGLMSIFWTQKVKFFYAALLANNSH